MKIQINTLSWTNSDPRMLESHKKVTKHFDIHVNYFEQNIPHGAWMNAIMDSTEADVVGFLDSDCVPIVKESVDSALAYVAKHDTFLGLAQASNHIAPKSHIFASPAFFFITKSAYERLGKPSFSENSRSDVAQEVSYRAEEMDLRYRALYPIAYEREPVEGVWRLGNYGLYGIGTVFESGVYHLYQGRYSKNVDLFVERCENIVTGEFNLKGMESTKNFEYSGKIVP